MTVVLPLRGVWRAGLIENRVYAALEAAGVQELPELTGWTRSELLALPGLGPAAVAQVERVLARYCLTLTADKRRRFRRPRYRLDPY
jgi:DNA-directed RNA polymerase alpha subunit